MYIRLLSLLSLITFFSCNAPRDNPVDPGSENYTAIKGTVQSYSIPYRPLKDVSVFWEPSKIFTRTDTEGKFLIGNATPSDGYLLFRKDGYWPDSVYLEWRNSQLKEIQINLNRMPVLDSSYIYTSIINLADNSRLYDIYANARITDEDKDIDSVIVENQVLKLRIQLEYDVISKFYQITISSGEIALNDIEDVIGKEFMFFVTDIFGKMHMVGNEHVTRVIRSGATVTNPDNNSTVDSLPTFTWRRFLPGYFLTYTVEVYKNDPINPQLVFRRSGINMDTASITLTTPLSPGNYFWVIWTTDSFKNSCRSAPALFNVL